MALVIESIDATGIVTRAPVEPGIALSIPAEAGTRYRIVDDQGRAVGAGPKVIRQGDDLAVENFENGEKIVLKNFFTACTEENTCALSTEEIGGEFEGLITPESEPVAAIAEGGYLMFVGDNSRSTAALPVEPGTEVNWKPWAAAIGGLVVVAGAAGGGGGGDFASDTTAPANPTIATSTVSSNALVVTGSAEANSTVTVFVDTTSNGTNNVLYTTTADANGVWSLDLGTATPVTGTLGDLSNGSTPTISAQATDAANNSSGLVSAQIAVGPNAPTIAAVEGNDIVNAAEASDGVEVTGTGEPASVITVTWGSATQTVTTAADGTWTATFDAATLPADGTSEISAVATNANGTASAAATREVTVDQAATALTVSSDATGVSNEAVTFTFDFGEAVTGFDLSDITVTNGTAGAFTAVSASEYTLVVEPDADAEVTAQVSVAADVAVNSNGNGNSVETATQAFDTLAPELTIESSVDSGSAIGPFTLTFTFSEAVTGFTAADVLVTGGTKGTFAGTGDTYTLVVTPTGGEIDVAVAANAAIDAAGNGSAAGDFNQEFDTTRPSVTIADNVAAGEVATGPVVYTFTFSEAVTGFNAADVIVAGGTKGALQTVTAGLVYRMTVTPTANAEGDLEVSVRENAAVDAAGNRTALTEAADQPFDTADPELTITANNGGDAAGPITYTFTFSEPVTGFTAADINVVSTGEPPTEGALVQVNSSVYRMVVTPADDDAGTLRVSVAANRYEDANGNANSTADTTAALAYDTVELPEVTITDNLAAGATANGPVTYTFTWSEPVTGMAANDVSVVNGTRGTIVTVTAGRVYRMVVTPDENTEGDMVVTVRANAVTDANGNRNEATASDAVTIDTIDPDLNITSDTNGDADEAFVLTFDFGEVVTGFTLADITVNAPAGEAPTLGTLVTTDDIVYTLEVTPAADESGNITFSVAAGAATDLANNDSEADVFVQGYDTSLGGITTNSVALNELNGNNGNTI
jgi:hypothetical protein